MSEHILWETIEEQKEKIADLEKENRLLGERCNQLLKDKGDLTDRLEDMQEQNSHMFNTISLQEQQIEKMKNCNNCKHGFCSLVSAMIDKNGRKIYQYWNEDKQACCDIGKNGKYQCWEIKE